METNPNSNQNMDRTLLAISTQKSAGTALLLTFLFGPLGMLYSTIPGAIIMIILSLPLALFTLGFSLLITWPICMIWAAIAARNKTTIRREIINYSLLVLPFLLTNASTEAQQILNNTNIIQLHKKQISKELIVEIIKKSGGNYNLSVDSIIYLKTSGVPNEVINEMLLSGTTSTPHTTNIKSNNKLLPGIYFVEDGNQNYKKMYPTVSSQSKSGGYLLTAMTYGIAKSKSKASVRGTESPLKIYNEQPKFMFVFNNEYENAKDIIASYFNQASSPNEFMLLQMTKRTNSREFVTGSANSFSHSTGVDEKVVAQFEIKDLGNGAFEVSPTKNLEAGEYCFMFAGSVPNVYSAQATKVYDFSIR